MSSPAVKPRRFDRDVNGILLLDKPLGLSSNAALQQARVLFRAIKAGHAGSLDPLASGMLPVCFGQATKICAFLLDARKTYQFTARLGERTDTADAEGVVIERQTVAKLTADQIQTVLRASLGEQQQVPPMYSALKHQGERLYSLARRGETVERLARPIVIESLALVRFDSDELELTVRCTKGTYVRTLAEDIAKRLKTVAHLTALRRLQVDPFGDRPMYSLDRLRELSSAELDAALIAPDEALPQLPAVQFDLQGEQALLRGQCVVTSIEDGVTSWVRMYGVQRRFLGLGEVSELVGELGAERTIQPRRLMVTQSS